MDWEIEGKFWPNRDRSSFVEAAGTIWHAQAFGNPSRDVFLLVHGTGASTHSFRHLAPLLAAEFHVIAIDLPGHGFTRTRTASDSSLPGMAKAVSGLLRALEVEPALSAGHSAGAAILLEMHLLQLACCRRVFGINAALEPIRGNALLSPLARAAARSPLTAHMLSLQARFTPAASMLLRSTRSSIDAAGTRCYEALFRDPGHVAGAISMMANWDLEPLSGRLGEIATPVTLIAALDDDMVPAAVSRQAALALQSGEFLPFPSGGHLFHEVHADLAAQAMLERSAGQAPAPRPPKAGSNDAGKSGKMEAAGAILPDRG